MRLPSKKYTRESWEGRTWPSCIRCAKPLDFIEVSIDQGKNVRHVAWIGGCHGKRFTLATDVLKSKTHPFDPYAPLPDYGGPTIYSSRSRSTAGRVRRNPVRVPDVETIVPQEDEDSSGQSGSGEVVVPGHGRKIIV